MPVYIVEAHTWEYHENIVVFSDREKAVDFCNENYKVDDDNNTIRLSWNKDGYYYHIGEYDVL